MKLLDDWRWIVQNAWSFRLNILAAVFSGLELILPMFKPDIPRGLFAVLTLIVVVGSNITRLIAQRHDQ